MAHNQPRQPIEIPVGDDLATILLHAIEAKISDIHLSVGDPPMYRLDGHVTPTSAPVLTRERLHYLLYDLLDDTQRKVLERDKELDFALQFGPHARFRVNCFYTMRGESAVFRVIPTKIRSFTDLNLPPVMATVADKTRGLVLVTGPTGSGKSTTLAAIIDYINDSRDEHILTIEDPIEFVHQHKRCIVNQREVGPNTKSFANALRSALREDPDVILVGEMRDLETTSLAITAAETGHLVFGTMHTQSAPKTCDRIIDVFPAAQQAVIRTMFAESFQAIMCQALLPKASGSGRIAAMEIMLGTTATRSLIREGKTHQLPTIIQASGKLGMQSMDQCLKDLLMRGLIKWQEAVPRAVNPEFVHPGGAEIREEEERKSRERRAAKAMHEKSSAAYQAFPETTGGPPISDMVTREEAPRQGARIMDEPAPAPARPPVPVAATQTQQIRAASFAVPPPPPRTSSPSIAVPPPPPAGGVRPPAPPPPRAGAPPPPPAPVSLSSATLPKPSGIAPAAPPPPPRPIVRPSGSETKSDA